MKRREFLKSVGVMSASGFVVEAFAGDEEVLSQQPNVAQNQKLFMKPDPKFKGRFIEGAGGVKLFVEEIGDPKNPSVLFIHGYSQCRLSWDRQFTSDLAKQFHLVRMDIRGHGLSDKPRDLIAYQEGKNWADDVQAAIKAFNLTRPVLCGWSYGGFVMCDYVRHHGQQAIAGVNFVCCPTEIGPHAPQNAVGEEFLALIPSFFSNDATESSAVLQKLIEMLCYEPLGPQDFYYFLGFNTIVPPYVRQGLFERQIDNVAVLKSLTLPVLITRGEADRLVLPPYADFIAGHIPHASKAYYPKCGHAPFFEVAGQFNRDLAKFVRQSNTKKG